MNARRDRTRKDEKQGQGPPVPEVRGMDPPVPGAAEPPDGDLGMDLHHLRQDHLPGCAEGVHNPGISAPMN